MPNEPRSNDEPSAPVATGICLCGRPDLELRPRPRFAQGRRVWRCRTCGLAQIAPFAVAHNADFGPYLDPNYHGTISDDEYLGYFLAVFDTALRPLIDARSRILDFGAGSCHYHKFLAERGFGSVCSLEPNPHLAESARRRFGVAPVVESISELADQKFDLVIANQVIEHIFDPIDVLENQIAPLLADGGAVVFTVPNFDSLNRVVLGHRWVGWSPDEHLWFFSPASVRVVLGRLQRLQVTRVVVRSALGTPHDRFRPKALHKRIYYSTIMRVFEACGRGDQMIVTLKRKSGHAA